MKTVGLILVLFVLIVELGNAQIISQWRGNNRDGIYNETNLLKEWPEEGPELLWFNDSLPKGYSSVAIDGETIYLTGIIDSLDYLLALNNTGELKWKMAYGRAFMESFQDSRSTPTIEHDKIYLQSGLCDIVCINKHNGEIIWKQEAFEKYEAKYGIWGFSESLLIVDDIVVFTPSGPKTSMVALNKLTGEEVWKTESLSDTAGYASPILIEENGKKIIVNVMSNFVLGVDAKNGNILFKSKYSEVAALKSIAIWPSAPKINTNSPIYHNNELYITSGYNHSGVKYKLSKNLNQIDVVWADSVLDVHHGGVVLFDGYIYGSNWINNGNGNWCCINWETGEAMYETKWQNKGSIICNDSLLYCYDEKRGNIALVEANPKSFNVISEFRVSKGKGPHWSHLVINKGKLYVRHENALMVYNLAKENLTKM